MIEPKLTSVKLTQAERDHPIWQDIKKRLELRLQSCRESNDTDLTPEKTARMRGRIEELKYLLSLDKPSVTSMD